MYVVNTREAARRRLATAAAAEEKGVIAFISPPYAACHAGVAYYAAFTHALREEFPHAPFTFTLCCGDDAAVAIAALQAGFTSLICCTTPGIQAQLHAVAADFMAEIRGEYPYAQITDDGAETHHR